ncbi:MAG: cadherin-like beta sandwich domain-containing protein [Bacilli bacterium]|nr:cadherin-like beta sandwich domain-containing protein [Bacilli bacterium]
MTRRKILLYFIFIMIISNLFQFNVKAEETDTTDNKDNSIIETNESVTGDLNNDSVVDYNDAKIIVDDILEEKELTETEDVNNDNKVNINDATNIIYKEETNEWNNETVLTDELSPELKKEQEKIYLENEVNVDLYINGFKDNTINGIEGVITYNKDKLQFLGIYNLNNKVKYGDINDKDKFIYLLDNYNSKDKLLTFRFKTLDTGYGIISLKDLILSSNGLEFTQKEDKINTTLNIEKQIIEELNNNEVKNIPKLIVLNNYTRTNNYKYPSFAISDTGKRISIDHISLSSDNTIKSLIIKNHKINFNKDVLEYSIKVNENTSKLDIKVILNHPKATYEIIGNKDFKIGNNKVYIAVTAEDGSVKNYIINVKKEKSKEKTSNSSRNVTIVLLVLIIMGLIYIIFKDDDEEQKEN